ncbi:MAG: hypothetical protein ACI4VP_01505 [Clostridia bacterium]
MERKNYLVEELSEDEDKYIICAINKAFLSSIRKYSKEKNIRKYSIDDVNILEQLPTKEDIYFEESLKQDDFVESSLVYSKEQQDICVQKLENLALQFGLERYLRTLTYNEKLVFFLSEIKGISYRKQAKLISMNRETIGNKHKSAKQKIEKERQKNGNR